jgi:hypothetical protein
MAKAAFLFREGKLYKTHLATGISLVQDSRLLKQI